MSVSDVFPWAGLAPGLPWCAAAGGQRWPAVPDLGCLPHVSRDVFCCQPQALVAIRDHADSVLRYRKQTLGTTVDHVDLMWTMPPETLHCPEAQDVFGRLLRSFMEARVLALGGLEVLRMGLQDLSCQVCLAAERERSAQVARVLKRDLEAVLERLRALRAELPAWRPCLPEFWKHLGGATFPMDVSVRSGGLASLQQWMESTAVAIAAPAGEFFLLANSLQSEPGHPERSAPLEAPLFDVPFPNSRLESPRAAVLIQGCADLSYPAVDFFTVGKEDCAQVWRKFPYANPATSVFLPHQSIRAAASGTPSTETLAMLREALLAPPGALPPRLPVGLTAAPVLPGFDGGVVLSRPRPAKRSLVFVCRQSTFCGGHGDRLFGLLSAYLTALLADRSFFIDMRHPVPLASSLSPKKPWPAVTDACATYRWTSAEDLSGLDEDVDRLLDDPRDVVCIASNVRIFPTLLRKDRSLEFTRAGLVSGLFLDLFALAPAPATLLSSFIESLRGRKLLGIHFRAGNESTWTDPSRHVLSELQLAFSCAAGVEHALGLQEDTAWLLAADTLKVREDDTVKDLHKIGKVVYLDTRPTHIDRSTPDLPAISESWAVWWALAFYTEALVLSHSNFGWSAAEVGQRRAFHFPTCRMADVTSP